LMAAVAFGTALNLLLVSSFVWPELWPSSLVVVGWLIVVATGCFCAFRAYRGLAELTCAARVDDRGLFIQAQGEYLKGHWYEAETLLQQLFRQSPRDADAQLMLATLYRHTRRFADAQACLERLECLDGADRWHWEIARERQLIEDAAQSAAEEHQGPSMAESVITGTLKAAS